jgi:hypothetical protein
MRRVTAIVLLFSILVCLPCFGETFLVMVREIRDGEELARPFASQEGMLEAMFDLGFVSFDTGLYAPAVDWAAMDFQEPLTIAREGRAQYVLAAEVCSTTEKRDLQSEADGAADGDLKPRLVIDTSVHYYLFAVDPATVLGEGELVLDNRAAEKQHLSYFEFLYWVGRVVAARGIDLLNGISRSS